MKEFTVFGYKHDDYEPVMVKSILGQTTDSSLLDIKFEANPIDKRCDQRVDVYARPLQIVYDADTIIQLLNVFKMPQNANLSEYVDHCFNTFWYRIKQNFKITFFIFGNRLTDAAADKLTNFKERSATGIQYMIEKHTRLEVNVSVQPNYVIVPHGGKYIEYDYLEFDSNAKKFKI